MQQDNDHESTKGSDCVSKVKTALSLYTACKLVQAINLNISMAGSCIMLYIGCIYLIKKHFFLLELETIVPLKARHPR